MPIAPSNGRASSSGRSPAWSAPVADDELRRQGADLLTGQDPHNFGEVVRILVGWRVTDVLSPVTEPTKTTS